MADPLTGGWPPKAVPLMLRLWEAVSVNGAMPQPARNKAEIEQRKIVAGPGALREMLLAL